MKKIINLDVSFEETSTMFTTLSLISTFHKTTIKKITMEGPAGGNPNIIIETHSEDLALYIVSLFYGPQTNEDYSIYIK